MTMAKYRDIRGMGTSQLVPRRVGGYETPRQRHERRLTENLTQGRPILQEWCDQRGIVMTVANHGHHWRFRLGTKLAEWWPSSAKLVCEKHYRRGTHCHNYRQVMRALAKRWKVAE